MKVIKDFEYSVDVVKNEQMYMLWISNQQTWQFMGFINEERLKHFETDMKQNGKEILENEVSSMMSMMMGSITENMYDASYVIYPIPGPIHMFNRKTVYEESKDEAE